jgi:hypothetical protein
MPRAFLVGVAMAASRLPLAARRVSIRFIALRTE